MKAKRTANGAGRLMLRANHIVTDAALQADINKSSKRTRAVESRSDFQSHNSRPLALRSGRIANVGPAVLDDLYDALHQVTASAHPRTFKLLQSGRRKASRKLIEEACEVTVEAVRRNAAGIVGESADLLYHLVVLWFSAGIAPTEVWQELQGRKIAFGIAEKLSKTSVQDIAAEK